ncbi:MAG TPA: hypothetical protein VFU65_03095 [Actinocrinis sp.]|nr:hypothetical protein [Actinocrinis sp.]
MSTSTDSSTPAAGTPTGDDGEGASVTGGGGRSAARSRAVAAFAAVSDAALGAVSSRVSRYFAGPSWQRTKLAADRVMLVVAVGALGWTLCSSVFLGTRAVSNRGIAVVHLGGQPEVQVMPVGGEAPRYEVLPSKVLSGSQTMRVSISIANDSPDGIVITPGTLTGPFLSGSVELRPDNGTGYILGNGTIHFVGTVTVDCAAATATARTLVEGGSAPQQQQPTAIAFELRDTNKVMHKAYLVIDTTAAALQGRVCTR